MKKKKKQNILKSTLKWFDKIYRQRYLVWLLAALVAFVYLLIKHGTTLTFLGIPLALTILMWKELWYQTAKTVGPRGRYIPEIVAVVAVMALIWGTGLAEPVGAQFYHKAEGFFCGTLTIQGGDVQTIKDGIKLTFNALRAFFLIYIAVSLIKVVNAVREDEDWQTLARTPILTTLIVSVGDLLTQFFVGNNASGASC
jgi:hypothetical protein